jgi:hypothetical protein
MILLVPALILSTAAFCGGLWLAYAAPRGASAFRWAVVTTVLCGYTSFAVSCALIQSTIPLSGT